MRKKTGTFCALLTTIQSVVFLCLCLVLGSIPCHAASDVALVNQVTGKAVVFSNGMEKDLELFDSLVPGDKVTTGAESKIVITFYSGERFRVRANSAAMVHKDKVVSLHGAVETLAAVSVMPQVAPIARSEKPGKRQASIRVRKISGNNNHFYPRHPGGIVLAHKAELSFPEQDKGRTYLVEIRDDQGTVIHSQETKERSVVLPADLLVPGKTYFWRVTTREIPRLTIVDYATFTTLSRDKVKLRRDLKAQYDASGDHSVLLLAVHLDHKLGLYREACTPLNDVIKARKATEADLAAYHKCDCSEYK